MMMQINRDVSKNCRLFVLNETFCPQILNHFIPKDLVQLCSSPLIFLSVYLSKHQS